jgi:hypothetical protein
VDLNEVHISKENKRKQHQSPDHVSHETDKERTKKSHGHSSDRKKSRRVGRFITCLFLTIVHYCMFFLLSFIVSLIECADFLFWDKWSSMVLVMNPMKVGTRDTGETIVILIEKVGNLKMENLAMMWLWIDGNRVY